MKIDKRPNERRNEICVVGVILMPMMKTFPAFEHNKNDLDEGGEEEGGVWIINEDDFIRYLEQFRAD